MSTTAPVARRRNSERAFLADAFDGLRALSVDGPGVTRESYGPGEDRALDFVADLAHREGLTTSLDPLKNLVIGLPRERPGPCVLLGSHLDSVPQGGNFDGAAGVLAGLVTLMRLKEAGVTPPLPVRVLGLRGEESPWFGKAYIGSSALMGALSAEDLESPHRDTGQSLAACMERLGIEVERVRAGERFLDPADVAAWLEIHIEQGPVMVARGFPTAVVTGLRGNVRHRRILCRGEAGHSGTVPRWLRRDAVFATAELIGRLDEHWRAMLEGGEDLVLTCGVIGTNPAEHAITRIPDEVGFSFEARSQNRATLDRLHQLLQEECRTIAAERGVEFVLDRRVDTAPAAMDEAWVRHLLELSGRLGLPEETLPSGAGHDAAVFANAGIPSAMIFVRNANGSHNPHEAMEIEDLLAAIDLMHAAVLEPLRAP
ncbi:hydantoinase/carbamoylase family amidase [Marinimicrococcus flavescens]|uniref:Hydantoinase/carbamoylase family amidase n=1 Tax=Marinimicrococcus flavescens TaxID=3031815 RepID=A0AAP3UY83_9PROT|nr:hydantoinase/carbamoylase family amidase [Marinimicrococcus flavescens]